MEFEALEISSNEDEGENQGIISDTFVHEGEPVVFYIQNSVTQGRGRIEADVRRHGGLLTKLDIHADTIIVDDETIDRERNYYGSLDQYKRIHIEGRSFVSRCVKNRMYVHIKPMKQGMPGRAYGKVKQGFTEEDDHELCKYIASVLPDINAGGRLGMIIYNRLMETADREGRRWARRHTAHSWRERYKKNRERMDQMIQAYVDAGEGKEDAMAAEYHKDRRYGRRHRVVGVRVNLEDQPEEPLAEEDEEESENDGKPDSRPLSEVQMRPRHREGNVGSNKRRRIGGTPGDSDDLYGGDQEFYNHVSPGPPQMEHPDLSDVEPAFSPTQRTLVNPPTQRQPTRPKARQVLPESRVQPGPSSVAVRSPQRAAHTRPASSHVPQSSQITLVPTQTQEDEDEEEPIDEGPQVQNVTRVGGQRNAQAGVSSRSALPQSSRSRTTGVRPLDLGVGVTVERDHITRSGRGYTSDKEEGGSTDVRRLVGRGRGRGVSRGRGREVASHQTIPTSEVEDAHAHPVFTVLSPARESLEDEESVKDLLEESFGGLASDVDELAEDNDEQEQSENRLGDATEQPQAHDPLFSESEEDEGQNDDDRSQGDTDVPSDSDDMETLKELQRAPAQTSRGDPQSGDEGDTSSSESSLDEDEDEDRLNKLTSAGFKAVMSLSPRGVAATWGDLSAQGQLGPRPSSSGNSSQPTVRLEGRVDTSFPSSGTRAREVREQHQREVKMQPYTPPVGSRARKLQGRLRF